MSPKLRVVLEKLAKQHPEDVLCALLHFETAGVDSDWHYCCEHHPGPNGEHDENCPLDKILTDIGLPDHTARKAMREELELEDS